jgi:hypothetical protein
VTARYDRVVQTSSREDAKTQRFLGLVWPILNSAVFEALCFQWVTDHETGVGIRI